jgi:hypothetical protein
MPSLTIIASNGEPMMNDCPTIFWSQPAMLPAASSAARMR